MTRAAEQAGTKRDTVYDYFERHPELGDLWEACKDNAADVREAEAHRRAVEGVEEPIVSGGKVLLMPHPEGKLDGSGEVIMVPVMRKVYSDRLLERFLEADRPQRFTRGSRVELTGRGGGPVRVSSTDRAETSQRLLVQLQLIQGSVDAEDEPEDGGEVRELPPAP